MTQTTFDLSALSDIADGAHTVKVKAKAEGYNDSEYSRGYEDGYSDAMSKCYGERSIHRSGQGLSREVYMRDPYMTGDEEYMERRRRDRMGRYM